MFAFLLLAGQFIFPPQSLHSHSSSIVELPDGRLMACWYIGSGERTADDVKIQAAYLPKGATQWERPFTLADTPGFPDTNPVLFVDRDQRLWLIYPTILDNRWEGALLKLRIGGYFDNLLLIPPDFPEKVPADKLLTRLGWMPRVHPLQLPSGRVLVPLYSDTFDLSLIAITDDGGLTWRASQPLISQGGVQPSLVRRKNGAIVAYMRDNGPPPQRILVSESKDDGLTWSPVVDSDIPNPGSSVEVISLKDGSWCMVLNDTEKERHRLSIWFSDDEGKSWPRKQVLEEDPQGSFSYPSVIQSSDGTIHVTYSYSLNHLQTIKHTSLQK